MTNPARPLSTVLARFWLWLKSHLVEAAIVVLFALVAAYYLTDRSQSFTVHAQTQSVTVVTEAEAEGWALSTAILCLRIPPQLDAAPAPTDAAAPVCDPRYYSMLGPRDVELYWPEGIELTIAGHDAAHFAVTVSVPSDLPGQLFFDGTAVTDGSLIIFDRDELPMRGTLPLAGMVRLGQPPHPGFSHMVRAGSYEIRETLMPFTRPTLVSTGALLPGDHVWITDRDGGPIAADLFITTTENERADFDVVLTTPQRQSAINVQRVGGAFATLTTRWTDRLTSDPLPVALSILLGLLGGALGIARDVRAEAAKKAGDHVSAEAKAASQKSTAKPASSARRRS